jgi:hypothetical protein
LRMPSICTAPVNHSFGPAAVWPPLFMYFIFHAFLSLGYLVKRWGLHRQTRVTSCQGSGPCGDHLPGRGTLDGEEHLGGTTLVHRLVALGSLLQAPTYSGSPGTPPTAPRTLDRGQRPGFVGFGWPRWHCSSRCWACPPGPLHRR